MRILPELSDAMKIAAQGIYKVLPVSCEILSDICTPIEALKKLKNVSAHCYMLESVVEREKWGCYTFLGYDPTMEITQTGGGSNAIGSFYHFIGDESVRLIGCEAAGRGIDTFETAATVNTGRLGIFHGMKSYFCQDKYGQIAPVYSISAGLDYPGIGPEHAHLHDIGRAEYVPVTDDEAANGADLIELGIIRKRRPGAGGRLCKIHEGCGAGGIESRHRSL